MFIKTCRNKKACPEQKKHMRKENLKCDKSQNWENDEHEEKKQITNRNQTNDNPANLNSLESNRNYKRVVL